MNEIQQFKYAGFIPVWCVVENGTVICCRESESITEKMKIQETKNEKFTDY